MILDALLGRLGGHETRATRRGLTAFGPGPHKGDKLAAAKALLPGPDPSTVPAPSVQTGQPASRTAAAPEPPAHDPLALAAAARAAPAGEADAPASRALAPQEDGGGGGGWSGGFDPVLTAWASGEWGASDLLGLPAVEACTSLIAGTIASLPAVVMEPDANGILQPRPAHPVSRLLAAPSRWLTPFEFMERLVADVATEGDGYAVITRDGRGVPSELRYMPVGSIHPERLAGSQIVVYRVSDPDENTSYTMTDEDVLHVRYRLNPRDRLTGLSPVRLGAKTLRLAAASVDYANSIFKNRGVPGSVITTAKPLSPKAKGNLRAQISAFFSGSGAGRAMVLEDGSTFTLIGHNMRDSQLVETSEALTAAVARLFGVPPALVGQAAGLNYSAMREVAAAWVRTGLRPWMSRFETALEDKLLSADAKGRGLVIRFDTAGLTRLDNLDRARFYQTLTTAGVLTSNECRAMEGYGPIEGGNVIQRTPGAAVAAGPGRAPGSGATDDIEPGTGSAPGGRDG